MDGQHAMDELNSRFYGRFPYPWPPMTFPAIEDRDLQTLMLNQGIGAWDSERIPLSPKVWVAGCGTNQAIYTALKFPDSSIVASDLSASSLELGQKNAKSMGIDNVTFRQESINDVDYDASFDYVICTGVIHHNDDPRFALAKLGAALKKNGVLELMVYNQLHRVPINAVQEAIGLLGGAELRESDWDGLLNLAKALVASTPIAPMVRKVFFEGLSEAALADRLIQPREHTYTVASLEHLARSCGLQILLPCMNQFDQTGRYLSWEPLFSDPGLQHRFDSLGDLKRWQVANLLLGDASPMIWFYLQHELDQREDNLERKTCDEFLRRSFEPVRTSMRNFVKGSNGVYGKSKVAVPFPQKPKDGLLRNVVEVVSSYKSMHHTLLSVGVYPEDFRAINEIRNRLTTPLFPYLRKVQ